MAAPVSISFDDWLSKKLLSFNTDVDLEVFVSYIHGILDTDEDTEDKTESICGLLGEIVEEERMSEECDEILNKWTLIAAEEANKTVVNPSPDFSQQMASIIESQPARSTKTARPATEEDRRRKAAILAQFDAVSDGELSDDKGEDADKSQSGLDGLARNVNASSVDDRVRAEREEMKTEHEARKNRDRELLTEQRGRTAERKDAEKKRTQKGEKRR